MALGSLGVVRKYIDARVALVAAGIVVAAILFWFLGWSNLSSQIANDDAKHQTNESQIAQLQQQLNDELNAKNQLPALAPAKLKLQEAVPDGPDVVTAINTFDDFARAEGVDVVSVTFQLGGSASLSGFTVPSGFSTMGVSLQIQGTPQAVFTFFQDLYNPAKMPRLFLIQSYSLSGQAQSGLEQATFNLTGFYTSGSSGANGATPGASPSPTPSTTG
jgi:hypothetical protein